VFTTLTPQNKPHDKNWLTPLFGSARPPPKARKLEQRNFFAKKRLSLQILIDKVLRYVNSNICEN
jgi:hypothetical protein